MTANSFVTPRAVSRKEFYDNTIHLLRGAEPDPLKYFARSETFIIVQLRFFCSLSNALKMCTKDAQGPKFLVTTRNDVVHLTVCDCNFSSPIKHVIVIFWKMFLSAGSSVVLLC